MGALVLVECKNWTEKVNAAVIRNLSQVMQMKGTQSLLLFARSGITQAAEEKSRQQALSGNYMLCSDRETLLEMECGEDFYAWLFTERNALDHALAHSQALWV